MDNSNYNPLSARERYVIESKGTEPPFIGEYDDFYEEGVYTCRRCDAELYRSANKFDAHCGWPAFDQEIPAYVAQDQDSDLKVPIANPRVEPRLGHRRRTFSPTYSVYEVRLPCLSL